MTNREAIEVISQDIPCEYDTDLIEALRMGIKALEQTEWIPVTERLPELGQMVLVTYADGDVETNERMTLKNLEVWKYGGNVVAWMPLPIPYKGDEK